MENAYEFKALAEKLKNKGLPVAEEAAEQAAHAFFEWLEESAKLSATSIDDMAVPFYPMIKSVVFKNLEKIDGK